jgi:hypothetical protein
MLDKAANPNFPGCWSDDVDLSDRRSTLISPRKDRAVWDNVGGRLSLRAVYYYNKDHVDKCHSNLACSVRQVVHTDFPLLIPRAAGASARKV